MSLHSSHIKKSIWNLLPLFLDPLGESLGKSGESKWKNLNKKRMETHPPLRFLALSLSSNFALFLFPDFEGFVHCK